MHCFAYKMDKQVANATGVGFAVIGGFVLAIGLLLLAEGEPFFLLPGVLLLFLASIVNLTSKSIMKIELQEERLVKETGTALLSRSRVYQFSDFHAVQIRPYMTGLGDDFSEYNFYYLQLMGKRNVSVPGVCWNSEEACQKGREIAELMGLSLIQH